MTGSIEHIAPASINTLEINHVSAHTADTLRPKAIVPTRTTDQVVESASTAHLSAKAETDTGLAGESHATHKNDTLLPRRGNPIIRHQALAQKDSIVVTSSESDTISLQNRDVVAVEDFFSSGARGHSFPYFPLTERGLSDYRDDASVEEIFGTHAVLVTTRPSQTKHLHSAIEAPIFQGFMLLLAAAYAMLLYRNLPDVHLLWKRVLHDRVAGERVTEEPGGNGFSQFLNIITIIGILFAGIAAVKCSDTLMPDYFIGLHSQSRILIFSLITTVVCLGVIIFQLMVLRLVGTVTLSQSFVAQLLLLKRTFFSAGILVTTPFLLFLALAPQSMNSIWIFILSTQLAITAILYFRETLNLFISKKVSVLHWILYLCIVEVFPISFLWLLAVR